MVLQRLPPMADLSIEQEAEPFGARESFVGRLDLAERLGHSIEAELVKQIERWMGEQGLISY
jgi:hypothetical protein